MMAQSTTRLQDPCLYSGENLVVAQLHPEQFPDHDDFARLIKAQKYADLDGSDASSENLF